MSSGGVGQVGGEDAEGRLHLQPFTGVPCVGGGPGGEIGGGEWTMVGEALIPAEALPPEVDAHGLRGGQCGVEESLGEFIGTRRRRCDGRAVRALSGRFGAIRCDRHDGTMAALALEPVTVRFRLGPQVVASARPPGHHVFGSGVGGPSAAMR